MINSDMLRYYIELCKCKNFTLASERLYISQPALSRNIQRLEEEIGTALIERSSRSFALTSAGHELLRLAEEHQEQERGFLDRVYNLKNGVSEIIKIGYGDTLCISCLINATQRMYKEYPNVIIKAYERPQGILLSELLNGYLDVVYSLSGYLGNHSMIEYEKILDGPLAVLVSNNHRFWWRNSIEIEELKNEQVCFYGWKGPISNESVVDFLNDHSVRFKSDYISNSFSEQIFRVLKGDCVSITHMLGNELFDTSPVSLKRVPIKDSIFPAGALCVAYAKNSYGIEVLISYIKEYAPSFQLD